MTFFFFKFIRKTQKIIALGIVFSFIIQTCLPATEMYQRNYRSDSMSCSDTQQCEETRNCSENCDSVQECTCNENTQCSTQENVKGCSLCGKPKPRPKPKQPKPKQPKQKPKASEQIINNLISTIVCDACDSECSEQLPEPIRRSYTRTEQHMLAPQDVLQAMPTLMRYALEHMRNAPDPRTQKAQCYVRALLKYVETHIEMLQYHPARPDIMDMLERTAQTVRDYEPLIQRIQRIANRMAEMKKRSLYQDEPTRSGGCCSSACTTVPLDPPIGQQITGINITGNYCLVADATTNIIINAANTSLDLNERKLTGWILINAPNVTVKNGKICPPAPIDFIQASTPAVDVSVSGKNTRLCCLVVECANSIGRDPAEPVEGTALIGRTGIRNGGEKTFILDCCVTSGAGADGNMSGTSGPFDIGGDGGAGIISFGIKAQIGRCVVMTGKGGNGSQVCIAVINGRNAGNGGLGIQALGENTCIFDCKVITGDGGEGGFSCCENGGNGGNAGDGIFNDQHNTQITNCSVQTGNGGNGGEGDAGNDVSGGQGGNGGRGIVTNGTLITNNNIATGNGGNGGDGGNPIAQVPPASKGGNGGHGIFVDINACNTKIRYNTIEQTGKGGNGGSSKTPLGGKNGDGGNGGDGVFINLIGNGGPGLEAQHTEVRFNTISNTGLGGTPGTTAVPAVAGTPGQDGRAVTDLNNDATSIDPACPATDNEARSIIYSNFAYAIGNTTIRYLLNGVVAEGGVNVTTPPTFFDNVYAA